jgi:hypothetical protein
MFYPDFYEREAVLKICPDRVCRRSGRCRQRDYEIPCARTHESGDEFRHALADKIERIARETPGTKRLDESDPDYEYKIDLWMAELKQALEEREREIILEDALKASRR